MRSPRLTLLFLALACLLAPRAAAQEIAVLLQDTPITSGVTLRAADGESSNAPFTVGGRTGWRSVATVPADPSVRYMYFTVEDTRFESGRLPSVMLSFDYYDEGTGTANIVYDSSDASVLTVPSAPGAWKRAGQLTLQNTLTWKTFHLAIHDARFDGRCNGADLRFEIPAACAPPIAELRLRKLTRICISDAPTRYPASEQGWRTRFGLYGSIGVEMMRIANFDNWIEHPTMLTPLRESALRIKYILYMLPIPAAYAATYPNERMQDNRGLTDWHLGPWNPAFSATVTQTAREGLQEIVDAGLADRIDEICVDLGPAGEGIYPANWTLNQTGEEGFWCYSDAAQADFRAAMQTKYGTLAAANGAWGLSGGAAFATWAAVAIPAPGTTWARGTFWNDMLTWYRDSKRRMILECLSITKALVPEYLGADVKCIVYLPGTAYTQAEWDDAVAQASGSASIRLMTDNDWLMTTALEQGCLLQYTGAENNAEVTNIVNKLTAAGSQAHKLLWAENAGAESIVRDPYHLALVITRNNLRGIDLTHANWLFADDGVTTNQTFTDFAHAIDVIQTYYRTGETLPDLRPTDLITQTGPGTWTIDCEADARLLGSFPDEQKGTEQVVAALEGGQSQRILLKFPFDMLSSHVSIQQATLVLKRAQDWGDLTTATLAVYRVTEPWTETDVTWNTATWGQAWSTPGGVAVGSNAVALGQAGALPYATAISGPAEGGVSQSGGYPLTLQGDAVSWDVTGLVNALRAGGVASDHGLLIAIVGGAGNKTFASRENPQTTWRPQIVIEGQSLPVELSQFSVE